MKEGQRMSLAAYVRWTDGVRREDFETRYGSVVPAMEPARVSQQVTPVRNGRDVSHHSGMPNAEYFRAGQLLEAAWNRRMDPEGDEYAAEAMQLLGVKEPPVTGEIVVFDRKVNQRS